jgi:hypothetical protein
MGECVDGKAAGDCGGREGEQGFSVYDAGVVDEDGGCTDLLVALVEFSMQVSFPLSKSAGDR